MELLKKLFPMAFTLKTDLATLIVDIIIHLLVGFGIYIVGDLLLSLGAFGLILYIITRIADLYILVSIVFSVLHYCKVIK